MSTNLILKIISKIPLFNGCIILLICLVLQPKPIEANPMALKYQDEISRLKLNIDCPQRVMLPNNQNACRFIFQPFKSKCVGVLPIKLICYRGIRKPVKHHINFLPNIIIDNILGNKYDYNNPDHKEVCSRCNVSIYDSVINAKKAWKNFPPRLKMKLGFTHVIEGVLADTDGFMDAIDEFGHFGFYEEIDADLNSKFSAPQPL